MEKSKKIFFVAGERSGDLHGGNLIQSLLQKQSDIQCLGWGGDDMQEAGMHLLKHYKSFSVMGFLEVLKQAKNIKKSIEDCKQQILSEKPDLVLLIDFGGFNMKIAEFCKLNSIPIHFYISPKIWAWNTSRARKVKAYVDKMYCILPFELDFYKQFDYQVQYVGNPVVDAVEKFKNLPQKESQEIVAGYRKRGRVASKGVVAILPGSRKQEVEYMLDVMVKIAPYFSDYDFVVAGVDNLDETMYQKAKKADIKIIYNQTYELLSVAKAALVTSGTATLETALFKVPQVVCYNANYFTYKIAKFVIKVKYISLVNLIANKSVVKELIQEHYKVQTVKTELQNLLENHNTRKRILEGYDDIKTILGTDSASDKVSNSIISHLNS